MKTKRAISIIAAFSMLSTSAMAESLKIDWSYTEAQSGKKTRSSSTASVPQVSLLNQSEIVTDHEVMRKTIFLAKLASEVKASLAAFHKTCNQVRRSPQPSPRPTPRPFSGVRRTRISPVVPVKPPVLLPKCLSAKQSVAEKLKQQIAGYDAQLAKVSVLNDTKVVRFIDTLRKLYANMKNPKIVRYFKRGLEAARMAGGPVAASGARSGGFAVTAGGAQDIAQFRKVVDQGFVPEADSMVTEGFLSEFNLSTGSSCGQLICVKPLLAVDTKRNKLFVQLDMNSKINEKNFARKPLNLSIVIDVSGSMSATDGTDKNRLEWAKEAAIKTVKKLNANDMVSVVTFNSKGSLLHASTSGANKDSVINAITTIKEGGSTDVALGLQIGYEQVEAAMAQGYENRVILITDAGHNTGSAQSNEHFLRMISQFEDEIGLTLLAVGVNFNQKLAAAIRNTKGGNEIFVQSGEKMNKLFNGYAFDLLVTPVAYNFKASLDLNNVKAKLVNTYGVPKNAGQSVMTLMKVRTLFFASASEGGAILLEYDLQ